VCHQSVGLIARSLEAAGVPTTSLTSAWSITAAVNPPRAAFVDHPLGRTAGKPHDRAGQRRIVTGALRLLESTDQPGRIVDLGERWGDDAWRANPLGGSGAGGSGNGSVAGVGSGDGPGSAGSSAGGGDTRVARHGTPQYQTQDDARLAAERLGDEVACAACAVFDG
jgi:hypothetical protein